MGNRSPVCFRRRLSFDPGASCLNSETERLRDAELLVKFYREENSRLRRELEEKTPIFYVYALIDPRTDTPFYIGKGKKRRAYDHLSKKRDFSGDNPHKHHIIRKLRRLGFEIPVYFLFESEDEELVFEKEKEWIKHYGRNCDGGILCNVAIGGKAPPNQAGKPRPQAVRDKISKTRKERKIYPREGIEASRISNAGKEPFNKGVPLSSELICRRQETRKLIKVSFETGDIKTLEEIASRPKTKHKTKKRINLLIEKLQST